MDVNKLCFGCFREHTGIGACSHCGFDVATYNHPPIALPFGTILHARYLTGRILGVGGFGVTYLALDLMLETPVAVKEYLPSGIVIRDKNQTSIIVSSQEDKAGFEHGAERFLNEARILAQLRKIPNIVTVYDYFQENNTAYYVMEYIEGVDLYRFAQTRGGRLSYEEASKLLLPMMSSLGVIHKNKLLHRDISPDNILVSKDGKTHLLDFGAAKVVVDQEKSKSVVLKRGFAPEEQYRSHGNQGPWTDEYAFAATMYRIITGERLPEAYDRIHEDTLKSPIQLGIDIPQYANDAIMKALAIKAENRFPDMKSFEEAITGKNPQAAASSEVSSKKESPKKTKKRSIWKRPLTYVIAGILLISMIAVAVICFISPWKNKPGTESIVLETHLKNKTYIAWVKDPDGNSMTSQVELIFYSLETKNANAKIKSAVDRIFNDKYAERLSYYKEKVFNLVQLEQSDKRAETGRQFEQVFCRVTRFRSDSHVVSFCTNEYEYLNMYRYTYYNLNGEDGTTISFDEVIPDRSKFAAFIKKNYKEKIEKEQLQELIEQINNGSVPFAILNNGIIIQYTDELKFPEELFIPMINNEELFNTQFFEDMPKTGYSISSDDEECFVWDIDDDGELDEIDVDLTREPSLQFNISWNDKIYSFDESDIPTLKDTNTDVSLDEYSDTKIMFTKDGCFLYVHLIDGSVFIFRLANGKVELSYSQLTDGIISDYIPDRFSITFEMNPLGIDTIFRREYKLDSDGTFIPVSKDYYCETFNAFITTIGYKGKELDENGNEIGEVILPAGSGFTVTGYDEERNVVFVELQTKDGSDGKRVLLEATD